MNPAHIAGQHFLIGLRGTSLTAGEKSFLREFSIAAVALYRRNFESVEQMVALIDAIHRAVDPPPLVGIDQEGGRFTTLPPPFTQFPNARTLGRTGDERTAYEVARATARELGALGIDLSFAPVLDVDTNPANPIIGDRSFSRDPWVVSRFGVSYLRGLQENGVIACGKHFPGHGDTSVDSHLALPRMEHSKARLDRVELLPFQQAIDAGVEMIMTAHMLVPTLDESAPATLSRTILQKQLRGAMKFDGIIFADDLGMKAIADHYGLEQAAELALEVGCDLLGVCHDFEAMARVLEQVTRQIEKKKFSEETLAPSLARLERLRQKHLAPALKRPRSYDRNVIGCTEHERLRESLSQHS